MAAECSKSNPSAMALIHKVSLVQGDTLAVRFEIIVKGSFCHVFHRKRVLFLVERDQFDETDMGIETLCDSLIRLSFDSNVLLAHRCSLIGPWCFDDISIREKLDDPSDAAPDQDSLFNEEKFFRIEVTHVQERRVLDLNDREQRKSKISIRVVRTFVDTRDPARYAGARSSSILQFW